MRTTGAPFSSEETASAPNSATAIATSNHARNLNAAMFVTPREPHPRPADYPDAKRAANPPPPALPAGRRRFAGQDGPLGSRQLARPARL
ncbi:MAG: hypothetical protein Kow00133_06260 [Amphiplicatus sp.]